MRKLSAEEHQRRLELYRMGMNDVEISETLKVPVTTVRGWRQRNGLIANNGVPMEWVLTADECKVMRRFLAALRRAHELNPKMDVGKFMREYRRNINYGHRDVVNGA